ncbi:permease, partial [Streptomyces pharetrae]|uniref:permease n=1 Tax=Streptomyces pharetrae TaxID=291370 RepID=UPI0033511BE8
MNGSYAWSPPGTDDWCRSCDAGAGHGVRRSRRRTAAILLGTVVSAAIGAFVPQRVLPRRPALAVPVAGAAGIALPGCECASVPVAGSLIRRG